MKPGRILPAGIPSLLGAVFFWPYAAIAQLDVASIVHRSAEANERDWAAVPRFDACERERNKGGDKTYAVTMLYGSPYERLIAVNGNRLNGRRQKQEQEKYEKAIRERQRESPDQRSQRIAKYQAERKRNHTLIQQLTTGFDFRLAGERRLNGYRVYVLTATPRQGYKPPDRNSQVLTGMQGTMWIDQKTFQWVKVEAQVIHPVTIEGFLAKVEPGTKFEVEMRPVAGDIWLVSHYSMKSNAKFMLLFRHQGGEEVSYFNYHRASSPAASR